MVSMWWIALLVALVIAAMTMLIIWKYTSPKEAWIIGIAAFLIVMFFAGAAISTVFLIQKGIALLS